jgi:hypothetical protein
VSGLAQRVPTRTSPESTPIMASICLSISKTGMALWYASLTWSRPLRRSSCRRRLIALPSSLWRRCISVPRALERDFPPKRISRERASRYLRKLVKWRSRHSICRCSSVRPLGAFRSLLRLIWTTARINSACGGAEKNNALDVSVDEMVVVVLLEDPCSRVAEDAILLLVRECT